MEDLGGAALGFVDAAKGGEFALVGSDFGFAAGDFVFDFLLAERHFLKLDGVDAGA